MNINVDVRFDTWIETLLEDNNCTSIEELPLEIIKDEIENNEDSIRNEKLWEMGAPTLEVSDMHRDNINAMHDYIIYLQEVINEKEHHVMLDNQYNPNGKDIRFINSNYDELFKIPDGDHITITLENGESAIYKCTFIDEYHTIIGNKTFHIHEFAEKIELIGSKCEPCPTPEKVAGYMITNRMPVNNKEFVMAHNPNAVTPWVTWVRNKDDPGYELGHYWFESSHARKDYALRTESERTGKPYDHATLIKQIEKREYVR